MLRSRTTLPAMAISAAALMGGASPALAAEDEALSSRLQVLAKPSVRQSSDGAQARAVALLAHGPGSLVRTGDGSLVVQVRVDGDLRRSASGLRGAGARIVHLSPTYDTITAAVAQRNLRAVGELPGVEYVEEAVQPMTGSAADPQASDQEPPNRAAAGLNNCATGGPVTEAVAQMGINAARTQYEVDGSGVHIGVLSDSFDTYSLAGTHAANDIASGDLPGPANPCGRTTPVDVTDPSDDDLDDNGTEDFFDEGRAMTQAVHDIAPEAQLSFSTAEPTDTVFADHIRALATDGADVIADDIIYFNEPVYQDGIIAEAINEVTSQGVSYMTMAYNSNRIIGGQNANSWEAPAYRSTACPAAVGGTDCMDFDPGAGTDSTYRITVGAGSRVRMGLNWAEPQFGVTDNFDLFMLNAAGDTVTFSSTANNITSGRAFEGILLNAGAAGDRFFVIKRVSGTGTPRLTLINSDNAATSYTALPEWNATNSTDSFGPTIYGHNGAAAAQTLGAVPFNNSSTIESYSARGPVTHLFGPVVGTTPAAVLASPQVLAKPDLSATDGGINTFFGPGNRFFGTSQSAPQAAAVAALQLQANPSLTPAQVRAGQVAGAAPVGAFGANAAGAGLLQAPAAIAANPPPAPVVTASAPGTTKDKTPAVTFTASGRPKTVTCKVDGAAAAPCSSPFSAPSLADGSHTVTIVATDYFAHSGSASKTIKVDTVKPKVKFTKAPGKKTRSKTAKFKIGTEAAAKLKCKLDKASAKSCNSKPKFSVGSGKHKLTVTATDAAGNKGSASYGWKVR
jgi:hypothetical protein